MHEVLPFQKENLKEKKKKKKTPGNAGYPQHPAHYLLESTDKLQPIKSSKVE